MGVVNDIIAEAVGRPGWSQARLARALDKRPQTINKWVTGENTPRMTEWPAIERALELEPGRFVRAAGGTTVEFEDLEFEIGQTSDGKPVVSIGEPAFDSKFRRLSPAKQEAIERLVDEMLGDE